MKNHSERGDFSLLKKRVAISNTYVKPQQKPLILLCGKLGRCQIVNYPPERVDFCLYYGMIIIFYIRGCRNARKHITYLGRYP